MGLSRGGVSLSILEEHLSLGGGGGMKEMVVVNNLVLYSILNQAIWKRGRE